MSMSNLWYSFTQPPNPYASLKTPHSPSADVVPSAPTYDNRVPVRNTRFPGQHPEMPGSPSPVYDSGQNSPTPSGEIFQFPKQPCHQVTDLSACGFKGSLQTELVFCFCCVLMCHSPTKTEKKSYFSSNSRYS